MYRERELLPVFHLTRIDDMLAKHSLLSNPLCIAWTLVLVWSSSLYYGASMPLYRTMPRRRFLKITKSPHLSPGRLEDNKFPTFGDSLDYKLPSWIDT
jgi:hypothetical protein